MPAVELPQMLFESLADLSGVEFDQLPTFHAVILRNNRVKGHLDRGVILRPVGDVFAQGNLARDILFGQGRLVTNDAYDAGV